VTIGEPTVVVVGAGYEGKRRCYERLAELGARLGLPTPAAQRVRSLDELFAAAADVGACR
jgi:hypothetical protein